ncbi:EC1118_1M3_1728p [Saccharomyces cerevisiae EC1118]|uniref:Uncharacterized protein YMR013C-A n=2 Tax=Saccharomyces cerevisiae TaxID=4932 RepID=YM13C_YEAST|nr:RecName: Full=Uncharacterized protein YMR013C-A [Saccharomyces cerevisiae S288C]CAY81836.1 EC1118_1M3_1728p [Saccharomyces cerevisiae EC1118]
MWAGILEILSAFIRILFKLLYCWALFFTVLKGFSRGPLLPLIYLINKSL